MICIACLGPLVVTHQTGEREENTLDRICRSILCVHFLHLSRIWNYSEWYELVKKRFRTGQLMARQEGWDLTLILVS